MWILSWHLPFWQKCLICSIINFKACTQQFLLIHHKHTYVPWKKYLYTFKSSETYKTVSRQSLPYSLYTSNIYTEIMVLHLTQDINSCNLITKPSNIIEKTYLQALICDNFELKSRCITWAFWYAYAERISSSAHQRGECLGLAISGDISSASLNFVVISHIVGLCRGFIWVHAWITSHIISNSSGL